MRLIKRLLAWINEPEQLGCPDREIHDRNNENSDVLVTAGERLAIDENTNARGEPDVIYLQLHDPASFDDTEKDDFRADGVTWCRHEINHNDVRYIREDLANPLPAQAIPEYVALGVVGNSDYAKGWNDCVDAMLSASKKP